MTEDLLLNKKFNEYIMQKIDDLTSAVAEIQISIACLPEKIFEKGDERYASKNSEKLVYGMVGVILTMVITALVYVAITKLGLN